MSNAYRNFVILTTLLLVACNPKYGNLKSPKEAIEAAKKHLASEVNLGDRSIDDYKFSAKLHESWTIPSDHCEDLQGYTKEEWQECNPPMYSVKVIYQSTSDKIWDHQSWYDDGQSIDGCFSGFFILFKSKNGEFVDLDRFVVLNELGETKCD